MNKQEMRIGFAQGRTLVQEETAPQYEIDAVDELLIEGEIISSPWVQTRYEPNRIRIIWPMKQLTDHVEGKYIEQKERSN